MVLERIARREELVRQIRLALLASKSEAKAQKLEDALREVMKSGDARREE